MDRSLEDGQVLRLGDADWQVVRTPGHTPGHLSLWEPDEGLLAVGDALSDYDVGWVNVALDGPGASARVVASLQRRADLGPRVLLPAHGPVPADSDAALGAALRRAQRLVDAPEGAVWYAARRIFAYALMIRGGIPVADVETYLVARRWVTDAARLLGRTPEALRRRAGRRHAPQRRCGRAGPPAARRRRAHAGADGAPAPAVPPGLAS